jgi:hypothetical protein
MLVFIFDGNNQHMKFLSLEPFIPSGANFESSKQFFLELGFHINWEVPGYIGFQRDECRFILQHFENVEFARNFMLSIKVDDVEAFRNNVLAKQLAEKYGIRIGQIKQEAYGREVNIIDIAGVCWHFVEQSLI